MFYIYICDASLISSFFLNVHSLSVLFDFICVCDFICMGRDANGLCIYYNLEHIPTSKL